jgi:hypothetical protein
LSEAVTATLAESYRLLVESYQQANKILPQNRGSDWKLRELDCLVINYSLTRLEESGTGYDTVRGAFLEREPAYPGAGFSCEAHIQIAARNLACILGVFRPHW